MGIVPPFQEINPSPEGHGKPVTMGDFVRDVFLEQVRTILRTCLERIRAWSTPCAQSREPDLYSGLQNGIVTP